MTRRRGRDTSGASTCAAHRGLGTRGLGTRSMGALDIGAPSINALDLGSLGISSPGTDARGMAEMPVHDTILHNSGRPGRQDQSRFLPLTKAAHAHAAYPTGQVVNTGKGLTFALGDDACRHSRSDAAQGLQLFGRGTVGVDGRVDSEGCVGEAHQVGRVALSENLHVARNARLDGIQNVSGHHHGGWRSIRGQVRRPCGSTACEQPRKQQKRQQKRPEDGNEPGKSARGRRQGGPCPEDGLHGELPVCGAVRADAARQRERA